MRVRLFLFAAAAAVAALPAFFVSCIYRSTGPSSAKMKQQVQNSWLFQSAGLFYPQGVPANGESYPRLDKASLMKLEEGIQQHIRYIVALHGKRAGQLTAFLGRDVKPDQSVTAVLLNEGRPTANSMVNDSQQLEINLDVRVLQANFRAALVNGLQSLEETKHLQEPMTFVDDDSDLIPPDKSPESKLAAEKKKKPETDDERIAAFLQFREEVSHSRAGNSFGDMLGAIKNAENSRWFDMQAIFSEAQGIELEYSGVLLFLLAHEVGHFALGHHVHRCDSPSCETFRKDEIDADRYAAYLLSGRPLLPAGETFFKQAYFRIGFVEAANSNCACTYPSIEERLKLIEEARDRGYSDAMDAYIDQAARKQAGRKKNP